MVEGAGIERFIRSDLITFSGYALNKESGLIMKEIILAG